MQRRLAPALVCFALACKTSQPIQEVVHEPDASDDTPAPHNDAAAPNGHDAAADPDAAAPDSFPAKASGGTRLKAVFARTPDGELYHQYVFFDTQLKVRCAYATAQDGKVRCLPLGPQAPLRYYRATPCTDLLLPADAACAGSYARQTVNGRIAIFRLGPAIDAPVAYSSYSNSPPRDAGAPPDASPEGTVVGGVAGGITSCAPDTTATNQKFFSLGDPVPPETFVAFDDFRPIAQPGHRVVPYGHLGEDGSKERAAWWDTKLKQLCVIDVASDGARRCLPYQFLYYATGYFADAACTQPIAFSQEATTPTPYFARAFNSQCPTRYFYYMTTPRTDLTTIYRKSSTGCTAGTPGTNWKLYSLGDLVPPTEFDQFTETLEGTGRLRRRVQTSADGTSDRLSNPFDTMFNDQCRFARTTDGKLRCVPYATGRADLYGDDACQMPVSQPARASSTSGGIAAMVCAAAPTGHTAVTKGPWCAPTVEIHALGAAVPFGYQRAPDGTCEATSAARYSSVGAVEDPAGYVEATEVLQ